MSDKLNLNIPDFPSFQLNQKQLDKIKNQNTIEYEEGMSPLELLERQAKSSENVIPVIQKIADSAKSQADSAEKIANDSKIQADLAVKKSKKADIKGFIAIAISFVALFFEFISNHEEIISYVKSFFNN